MGLDAAVSWLKNTTPQCIRWYHVLAVALLLVYLANRCARVC